MKNIVIFSFILFSSVAWNLTYAGGCAPNTSTGSCGSATALTVGAVCVSQTTCNGATPNAAGSGSGQCSWSSFVATTTDMVVSIPVTNSPGCYITSSVYSRTGACSGLTEISSSSGAPMDDAHYLNNLVVGQTYYVEVCEPQFGPCGGDEAVYCIEVDDYTPCDQCSTPCGVAQGFPVAPTAATVVAGCTAPDYSPLLQPGHTYTFCNTITAVNTSVDFNVIITSNCGAGNVTAFSWALYNYPSCGAAIQTGTLASLTFSGLTIGNGYSFCYTFTVPSGCTHTKHCPYFVGASPLPVKLLNFDAETIDNKSVKLDWSTASELNNDFFTIERSKDGEIFEVVGIVDGAGNSNMIRNYDSEDTNPYKGTSYYRLKQTDYDGKFEYSAIKIVKIRSAFEDVTVYPNPVTGNGNISFHSAAESDVQMKIFDITGKLVADQFYKASKGENVLTLNTELLEQGMYFVAMDNGTENISLKFIKE